MRATASAFLASILLFSIACVSSEADSTEADADVLFVRAVQEEAGTWTFSVTVRHADTGWQDYANGWDLVTSDGTILKPDPESPFTRLLLHPHVDEQPFTRSQTRVLIPQGVTRLLVRAHDLKAGFGGKTITVDLTMSYGEGYEVVGRFTRNGALIRARSTAYTYVRSDGNKLVEGHGTFPEISSIDIVLQGRPAWIAAAFHDGDAWWAVVLENGDVRAYATQGNTYREAESLSTRYVRAAPIVLGISARGPLVLLQDAYSNNYLTHPVLLPSSGTIAAVDPTGNLVLRRGGHSSTLPADALVDGRILFDTDERILLLAGPSRSYRHGILGDRTEATHIVLVDTRGLPKVIRRIGFPTRLPRDLVIEGLYPIWTDIDADGAREIVVTASSPVDGARIAVFEEDGTLLAEGPPIGVAYRWLHQIAVAPFGPAGETELAIVRTPHIGGIVEFYRLIGAEMRVVARRSGYSSHRIGSRNLDMAIAGDFTGDRKIELLVPTQDFRELAFLTRSGDGVGELFRLPVGGELATNIAALETGDGGISIGVVRTDGVLRIWSAQEERER